MCIYEGCAYFAKTMKRYFAAAVLNKLEEPWHKPNKSGNYPKKQRMETMTCITIKAQVRIALQAKAQVRIKLLYISSKFKETGMGRSV